MRRVLLIIFLCMLGGLLFHGLLANGNTALSAGPLPEATPTPAPTGQVATPAQVEAARAVWLHSRHANTFDAGQGANTTCARCKAPLNWDPAAPGAEQALDCGACKRVPGAPRPDLEGGVPVAQAAWKNIGCEICHRPRGTTYETAVSYYNAETRQYEAVANTTDLCAKCHEGRHGFQVVEEQEQSPVHRAWECTRCHGAHGSPARCTDCHDAAVGKGAADHLRHPNVNCTACHDAGGLSIWQDSGAGSKHSGTYVPLRFAHTLTSWPSHDLQREVNCKRCHHPQGVARVSVVPAVGCDVPQCHPSGAVLSWCPNFPRPNAPAPPPHLPAPSATTLAAVSGTPSLVITSPAERETFYAGLQGVRYSMRVTGQVSDGDTPPQSLQVRLDLVQGTTVTGSVRTRSAADGSFAFNLTVNPTLMLGDWSTDHTTCNECHFDGQLPLPPGPVTLRVTMTGRENRQAVAERQILVDQSQVQMIPVRAVLVDNPAQGIPQARVTAVSRLYEWRGRSFSAATSADGRAMIKVEALTQAATEYRVTLDPIVVDGVLYEGVEPVSIILVPGATEVPTVTLQARARRGAFTGTLQGDAPRDLTVWAIRLPDGTSYRTEAVQGAFSFQDLPIATYLVVPDAADLAAQGLQSTPQAVDLADSAAPKVDLLLAPLPGRQVRVTVREAGGAALPFAWLATEPGGQSAVELTEWGGWSVRGVTPEAKVVIVSVPGYYSTALPLVSGANSESEVQLTRRLETRVWTRGSASVLIPPESGVDIQDGVITLNHGWVWGRGGPLTLRVDRATIQIEGGEFAAARVPGRTPSLYLRDGQARVAIEGQPEAIAIGPNTMLALTGGDRPFPAPFMPQVLQALGAGLAPVEAVWEPSLEARWRDSLARLGIGTAQSLTFATYAAMLVLLAGLPLACLAVWLKRKQTGG